LSADNGNPAARDAVVLSSKDNVATALRALQPGQVVSLETPSSRVEMTVIEAIPLCHKFAIDAIAVEQPILKYGEVIGVASQAVVPGVHVHVHNIRSLRAR
jgi:altronate dehydratase small subunit